jgi:hypothetical protein
MANDGPVYNDPCGNVLGMIPSPVLKYYVPEIDRVFPPDFASFSMVFQSVFQGLTVPQSLFSQVSPLAKIRPVIRSEPLSNIHTVPRHEKVKIRSDSGKSCGLGE